MTDEALLYAVKKNFNIKEFVSKRVYKKYGESAWKFICPRLLETMVFIRKELNKPITINNWSSGGKFQQRGLRSNLGYIFYSKFKKSVMYLSAHVMGKAVDFDVQGMTANEVREWLVNHLVLPVLPVADASRVVEWYMQTPLSGELILHALVAINMNTALLLVLYPLAAGFIRLNNWVAKTDLTLKRTSAKR